MFARYGYSKYLLYFCRLSAVHNIILQALSLLSKPKLNEGYVEAQRDFSSEANPTEVAEYIEKYRQLVANKKIKGPQANIDYWRNNTRGWDMFTRTIDQLTGNNVVRRNHNDIIIVENDKWLILIPQKMGQRCYYGDKTSWCARSNINLSVAPSFNNLSGHEVDLLCLQLGTFNMYKLLVTTNEGLDFFQSFMQPSGKYTGLHKFESMTGLSLDPLLELVKQKFSPHISLDQHDHDKLTTRVGALTKPDPAIEQELVKSGNITDQLRYGARWGVKFDKADAWILAGLYSHGIAYVTDYYISSTRPAGWREFEQTLLDLVSTGTKTLVDRGLSDMMHYITNLEMRLNDTSVVDQVITTSLLAVARSDSISERTKHTITEVITYINNTKGGKWPELQNQLEAIALELDNTVPTMLIMRIFSSLEVTLSSKLLKKIMSKGKTAFFYMSYISKEPDPTGEQKVIEECTAQQVWSYCNAVYSPQKLSQALESRIAELAYSSYDYAAGWLGRKRFPAGETIIGTDPHSAANYARQIIKAPWSSISSSDAIDRIIVAVGGRFGKEYAEWLDEFKPKSTGQRIKEWFKAGQNDILIAFGASQKVNLSVKQVSKREVPDDDELIYRFRLKPSDGSVIMGTYDQIVSRVTSALDNNKKLKNTYPFVTLETDDISGNTHVAVVVDLTIDTYTNEVV